MDGFCVKYGDTLGDICDALKDKIMYTNYVTLQKNMRPNVDQKYHQGTTKIRDDWLDCRNLFGSPVCFPNANATHHRSDISKLHVI